MLLRRSHAVPILLLAATSCSSSSSSPLDMPRLAIGSGDTACAPAAACEAGLRAALQLGFRHIDTAYEYGTQPLVGAAFRASGLRREEVFITTKIPGPVGFQEAGRLVREDLKELGLAYVDQLLMHYPCSAAWPQPRNGCSAAESAAAVLATWRALEQLVDEGLVRRIGVSNFHVRHLERLLSAPNVTAPSTNQVEWHLGWHDDLLLTYCRSHGITLQAYSPLGGGGTTTGHNGGIALDDPAVASVARAHNVSEAQVALRWSLQQDVAVIAGTTNPKHLTSDLAVLNGPVLQTDEMRSLSSLQAAIPSVRIVGDWPDVMMPEVALGTSGLLGFASGSFRREPGFASVAELMLRWARLGGRHVSCNSSGEELREVGLGLARITSSKGPAARDELFVTALLPASLGGGAAKDLVLQQMLPQLGTSYVDLLLMQKPAAKSNSKSSFASTWLALEELRGSGAVRAIGVADLQEDELQDLILRVSKSIGKTANISINQVEWHLGFHQDALQSWCQARNITVQARSALGFESSGALHPAAELLEVALRWSLQRTVPVIIAPRLQHQLMDDLAPLVNFTLTHEEMEALSTLQSTALVV